MSNVVPLPIAAQVGATSVSVAQLYSGTWAVVAWHHKHGQWMIGNPTDFASAVARANSYCDQNPNCIANIPGELGQMHVLRNEQFDYEVVHEGTGGGSYGVLKKFPPHQRETAVSFAMSQLGQYSPCQLGEVAA